MLFPFPVLAQAPSTFNPRDDEYRLLGLIRAKAEFERASAEWTRTSDLYDGGVVSRGELDRVRARMENARVDYLQASLAVLFEEPHVLIERAVKSQSEEGEKLVHLTLRNTSASSYETETLGELIDPEILDQLAPERVRSVFVSLKAEPGPGGAIISIPYEHRIAELDYGDPQTLSFRLLRDRDDVTVALTYAGRQEEKVVFLEKDTSANMVSIQSTQFSQEVDLGGQATYDLALERFTDEARTFRLTAMGLPSDIRYEFRDPDSGARLTQVRFPMGVSQRNLSLTVYLPQRAGGSLPQEALDRPLPFFALVLDEESAATLDEHLEEAVPGDTSVEAVLDRLGSDEVRLELIPRGIGRVELSAQNLYHEILPGDSKLVEVVLRNTGSRQLEGLRLLAEPQLGWHAEPDPDFVTALPVDGEVRVLLAVTPPEDVAVGDYQVRLRAETSAADRRVESQETALRFHVRAQTNPWLTLLLITLLVGLVVGIVVFGIRLTRG